MMEPAERLWVFPGDGGSGDGVALLAGGPVQRGWQPRQAVWEALELAVRTPVRVGSLSNKQLSHIKS